MSTDQCRSLKAALKELEGLKIWSVMASKPTGWDFTLDIGEKWKMPWVDYKDKIAVKGEFCFFVQCAWRITVGKRIIISSSDYRSDNEAMLRELDRLTGLVIERASVSSDCWNFSLAFSTGTNLDVFSDQSTRARASFCYQYSARDIKFSILSGGVLESEPRFTEEQARGVRRDSYR